MKGKTATGSRAEGSVLMCLQCSYQTTIPLLLGMSAALSMEPCSMHSRVQQAKKKRPSTVCLFMQLLLRFCLTQPMLRPDVRWEQPCQVQARALSGQEGWPESANGPLMPHDHLQTAVFCSHYLLPCSFVRIF